MSPVPRTNYSKDISFHMFINSVSVMGKMILAHTIYQSRARANKKGHIT